jgi:hypothetical protein
MSLGFNTALRTARAQHVVDALDANASAGYVELYSGSRPATGAAIGASVLLATCTLSKPSAAVASGVSTFNAVTNGTGTAGAGAGTTATWCRFKDGSGAFVMDGSVGTSGADINMNSTTVATGQTVSITTGGTITEGNA